MNIKNSLTLTLYKAIEAFKKDQYSYDLENISPMTLRMPANIKYFYECLAEHNAKSLQAAILGVLTSFKESAIDNYNQDNHPLSSLYNYQVESFFIMLESQAIDYNDIDTLFSELENRQITKDFLCKKENIISLLNKNNLINLSMIFGYAYEWFSDRSKSINLRVDHSRWYKMTITFVNAIIDKYVIQNNTLNTSISFLTNDKELSRNIASTIVPKHESTIIPVIELTKKINNIIFTTYHVMDSGDINYLKCRKHLIELLKQLRVLHDLDIVELSNCYLVENDMLKDIASGVTHPSTFYKNMIRATIEDFVMIEDLAINNPVVTQIISTSFLSTLATFPEKEEGINRNIPEDIYKNDDTIILNAPFLDYIKNRYNFSWITSIDSIHKHLSFFKGGYDMELYKLINDIIIFNEINLPKFKKAISTLNTTPLKLSFG